VIPCIATVVGSFSPVFVTNQTRFLSSNINVNRFRAEQPFMKDRFQTNIQTSSFKQNFNNRGSRNNFHQSNNDSYTNHSETLRTLLSLLGITTAGATLYGKDIYHFSSDFLSIRQFFCWTTF
jgi:hypothetical protein